MYASGVVSGWRAARVGIDLVLTRDGYEYVFGAMPGDDSATVAATGVEFRPVVDSFRDMFDWVYANNVVSGGDGRVVVADS